MTEETSPRPIRRGLPRVHGGAAWPEATQVPVGVAPAAGEAAEHVVSEPLAGERTTVVAGDTTVVPPPIRQAIAPTLPARPDRVRRGLPRTHDGEPWPPAPAPAPAPAPGSAPAPLAVPAPLAPIETVPASPVEPVRTEPVDTAPPEAAPSASERGPAPGATRLYRGRNATQWVWRSIGAAVAIIAAAGILVLAARGLLTFRFVQDFVHTYPGDYALPASAPVGFPAWVGWQHFCNAFLIVLIIRSGIQVRRESRPKASWTPRWNANRKISLTLWLHQSLDLLWIVNGLLFVVLLFCTGQWMRVIPTSWSVFPNAISAALHYASLNWPTDDGWANYNSLQQLTYFATVFVAAPLAAVTGVRMSGLWPKKAERLSRVYPVELARAIHFPVMVYFVAFIVVHVALVFSTGALRNLNHMYGGSDQVNWVGFWIFVVSVLVMAGGWIAARPVVVAPIASLFGRVGR